MFFLVFGLWMPDLDIFDMRIGFLIKSCMYRQLKMFRIRKNDENRSTFIFELVLLKVSSWG